MTISIITPCYNAEEFLDQTIASVQTQTYTDWELILVDDGSSDGTAAIIQSWVERDPRIRALPQQNQGVARARNNGWDAARTDSAYLMFFDHDDVMQPDALETLVHALETHPEWVAAYGLSRYLGEPHLSLPANAEHFARTRYGLRQGRVCEWAVEEPTSFEVIAFRCCVSTPGQALIRRACLEKAGKFDPESAPADDWDMWIRLTAQGNVGLIDRVTVNWRQHGANGSRNVRNMQRADRYVRQKFLSSDLLTRDQKRIILQAWRAHLRFTISDKLRMASESFRTGNWQYGFRNWAYTVRPLVGYFSTLTQRV